MTALTTREQRELDQANQSGKLPVTFVHGLWLLPSSWDRWRELFEQRGFVTLAPSWPDDPATVPEAREHPEVLAGKSVGAITDHFADVIRRLDRKPVIVGHSFGGLITQKLAGLGLATAAVAIDPTPFRGVLPLPFSALKAASPVLANPRNRKRAVLLTPQQFRFAFANAVSEREAQELYDTFHVAGSGIPVFQAALANLNPRTEASVDTKQPNRGPLLITCGEKDNTVPWAIANASFKQYAENPALTEIIEVPGRGHSLVIDSGWREFAETVLTWVTANTHADPPRLRSAPSGLPAPPYAARERVAR